MPAGSMLWPPRMIRSLARPDEAVGVDTGEIARVQPAVADLPGGLQARPLGCVLGDVAGEDHRTADGEHAGGAGRQVAPLAGVRVDPYGPDPLVGQAPADTAGPGVTGQA
ncbi:hypothetical protein GCM10010260_73120 [Streptomyces filipinensis]|uniref:Uncharacterized protein n=1 Tax=Streptomyces filipinensis TaxID=66887 RepID=A0A918MFN4_9ACTN|nr:hypothetical protein GCM10010260_73120 [Streptomyces filipinensis]